MIQWILAFRSLVPVFSKSNLYIWKFSVHVLLKPNLKDFEHCLASIWNEWNCVIVWKFFGIALINMGKFKHILFFSLLFFFSLNSKWIIYNLSFIMTNKFLNYEIIWHLLYIFCYSSLDSPVLKSPVKIQSKSYISFLQPTINWLFQTQEFEVNKTQDQFFPSFISLQWRWVNWSYVFCGYFCSTLFCFWVHLLWCW